jgi:hypothetical protein
LSRFQATHDTEVALDRLPAPEQNEILKSIAQKIKEVALAAADRFRALPTAADTQSESRAVRHCSAGESRSGHLCVGTGRLFCVAAV